MMISAPSERARASLPWATSRATQPHFLSVLHRNVTQPADSEDGKPVTGFGFRVLDALGEARAQNRRERGEVGLGHSADISRIANHILGEAAINAIVAVVLR